MSSTPVPPDNVRLIDPMGNSWPCDVVYDGMQGDCHMWLAIPRHVPTRFGAGWKVRVGTMPGKTGLRFAED